MPFTDDFAGTNNTDLADYSPNWTRLDGSSGSAAINAGQQVKNSPGSETAYTAPDCGTADHYAQATLQAEASGAVPFAVCVRVVDSNNFIGARHVTGTGFELYKRVSSTFTLVGNYTGDTLGTGDDVKVEMSGTGVTCYDNGVSRITGTVSDGVFTDVTTCGLVARGDAITAWLDDWESTQSAGIVVHPLYGGVVRPGSKPGVIVVSGAIQ